MVVWAFVALPNHACLNESKIAIIDIMVTPAFPAHQLLRRYIQLRAGLLQRTQEFSSPSPFYAPSQRQIHKNIISTAYSKRFYFYVISLYKLSVATIISFRNIKYLCKVKRAYLSHISTPLVDPNTRILTI